MDEIKHLKSMWGSKVRRHTKLIVPKVTYKKQVGSLNNDYWAFQVPYFFRDAIDIKYEQRMKNKKPYMVWTQGPIINFGEGDLFSDGENMNSLQIKSSMSMGWDKTTNKMFRGSVEYTEYKLINGIFKQIRSNSCNQMQFLELLIFGQYN